MPAAHEPVDLLERESTTVLVLEDDFQLRRAMSAAFESLGMHCVSAGSVRDADAILRSLIVDLVVCDVHLPDGDAFSFRRSLSGPLQNVPSILITGDVDPYIHRRGREVGYGACVRKPLLMDDLVDMVGYVQRSRARTM